MNKTAWMMVPVACTPDMAYATKDLYISAEEQGITAPKASAIYHTMLSAAPSPWIPLDPSKPGFRLPTAEDADWRGDVMVFNNVSRIIKIRLFSGVDRLSFSYWSPMPAVPSAYDQEPQP